MKNDPVLSRLGFARRAGRLSAGFAKTKESCLKNKAKLITVAYDVSEKSEKEIRFISGNVPVVRIPYTVAELSEAIGTGAGIVCVCDDGFAKTILEQLEGGNHIC